MLQIPSFLIEYWDVRTAHGRENVFTGGEKMNGHFVFQTGFL
jgi:hypothetical protein